MKYYAVRIGKVPGIYNTWDECKAQVFGHKGAVYKKFENEEDAKKFLNEESTTQEHTDVESLSQEEIIAYVDGSFSLEDKTFSYGVLLFDKEIYETHQKRFYGEDWSMRNVSGEIKGAMFAMERAIELGKKTIYLHYDYAGIEQWATGAWKTNKAGTIEYKRVYDSIKDQLKVIFIKVKAHSGVKYNEIVDELAKGAV